jgi:2,4-dienoyl-CoA reductase-like NADH-dependent reductase (Old Yellow Enzyme family)
VVFFTECLNADYGLSSSRFAAYQMADGYQEKGMLFDSFNMKGVHFKNRILRSSMGGRTSYYDGSVSPAWRHFERKFSQTGVAGIISATIDIDDNRLSPLEYPKLSDDRFIAPLREGIKAVHQHDCRYIIQIGDPGGQTQTSLLAQDADAKSASSGFDLLYGYRNHTVAMTIGEVEREVEEFEQAARRVRETGADGIEVTASKGYIIHQFLNPATNRRTDRYGGSPEKRFQLLREIATRVRATVGIDFLFGIRLSAEDFNYLPVNVRLPIVFPLRHYFFGNSLEQNLAYGRELEKLGIDYLHIDSGFGFINPKGNPGAYPIDGIKLFANSTRHLSAKAAVRAMLINCFPAPLARLTLGLGWKFKPAANADYALAFKQVVKIPVISNGGFQRRDIIESTLSAGKCDLIAIARPLLANPDLLQVFAAGRNEPENACTFCNRCCSRTAVLPLGCYEESRFTSQDEMKQQILAWSGTPDPPGNGSVEPR